MTVQHTRDAEEPRRNGLAMVVVVTCELCGQTWQRRTAGAEQTIECVFCGCRGQLRLGPAQPDGSGTLHVEGWLHPSRGVGP